MTPLNAVIIDDEPLARAALRRLLGAEPDIAIAGEAADGDAALALLQHTMPDLVFLDVQLPGLTGPEILRRLPVGRRPAVIFVTAHGGHALQAFELHAVDYLLKPYTDERFHLALARARRQRAQPTMASLLALVDGLLRHWPAAARPAPVVPAPDQLIAKSGTELHVFRTGQVKWVQGQGDYLKIHSAAGNALVRETMGGFLGRVPPGRFIRVHKSAIVNLAFVRRLESIHSGDYRLELTDGTVLRVSRTYREQLRRALGSGGERMVAPANASPQRP
ncbi:MAG TPA: LytTR family DNA-binding domain-containing protein [Lacunisphaera sp.]